MVFLINLKEHIYLTQLVSVDNIQCIEFRMCYDRFLATYLCMFCAVEVLLDQGSACA